MIVLVGGIVVGMGYIASYFERDVSSALEAIVLLITMVGIAVGTLLLACTMILA